MSKKSIIAILSAVVLMVVASIAMVFTVGPKTSAADETVYTVPVGYLNIDSYGVLGDGSYSGAFTADGKTWIQNHAKYRVEIPEGVTGIRYDAFRNCSGLTSITIPTGVTGIGNNVFRYCSGLTSITIPAGVTSISNGAFSGCRGLTSMTVNPNNTKYTSQDNEGHECNCIIEKSTNILLFGCQNTIIPAGVTSIGEYAFENCRGITSITIPESVTSIGNYAFNGCSGLTSITIPEGMTSIGRNAFDGCSGLTSITIPNGVTSIGERTFLDCSGLTSITIPGVTSIGNYAFYNCSALTSITIPEGVTRIGYEAFYNCRGLTSITIPEGVTSIGDSAFNGCRGLNEIIVRNPDLMTNTNLQGYASKLHYGADQNTVTFNTMGGGAVDNQTINFGEYASVPNPEKEGYHVTGWYSDEQYTQPFTFDTPIKYDITLYAKWQINQYTVEFWWQNGTHTGSQTVDYGTPVQRPTDPTKEGYTFVGWFTDDLYQHPYDFNTPVTKDFGLFAQWTINQYTVTFDSKQGSSVLPQTVNWNTKISRPSDPVREGYDFLGWYLNNEEYNFDECVTDNMTLTAKWKSNNPDFPNDPADPTEENPAVNNQNNSALIWGIAGTAAGILIIGGIVFGIVISKRRRK